MKSLIEEIEELKIGIEPRDPPQIAATMRACNSLLDRVVALIRQHQAEQQEKLREVRAVLKAVENRLGVYRHDDEVRAALALLDTLIEQPTPAEEKEA